MIKLVNLYDRTAPDGILPGAVDWLYELMKEREPKMNISHKELPTFEEHTAFVTSKPYRYWHLIVLPNGEWAGYLSATHANEIGIFIRKAYHGQGYGPQAIMAFVATHRPNPGKPSQRNGAWLANINPENEHSKHVFQKLGFRKLQETFILEEDHGKTETEGPARQPDAGQGAGDSADALDGTET